jgi:hypothetical protein
MDMPIKTSFQKLAGAKRGAGPATRPMKSGSEALKAMPVSKTTGRKLAKRSGRASPEQKVRRETKASQR